MTTRMLVSTKTVRTSSKIDTQTMKKSNRFQLSLKYSDFSATILITASMQNIIVKAKLIASRASSNYLSYPYHFIARITLFTIIHVIINASNFPDCEIVNQTIRTALWTGGSFLTSG
jgi:hypothetical protein